MLRAVAGSTLFVLVVLSLGCPGPAPADTSGSDGGCTPEVIDADAGARIVSSVALALDGTGAPQVAYFDSAHSALRYGKRGADGWTTEAVASQGGSLVDLALSSAGKAHVSYYDSQSNAVRYASNSSGAWLTEKIADGSGSSLRLDSGGAVHVALTRNVAPKSLQLATRSGGTWTVGDVDATGDCEQPSMALDAAGKHHISYHSGVGVAAALNYTTDVSGSWVTVSLDVGGVIGSNSSLALDSQGRVHITYFDYTHSSLKYATNASGTWVVSTLDVAGTVGAGDTSLAIDVHDKLYVTYYQGPSKDLGYLTNASGSWVARSLVSGSADFGNASSVAIDSVAKTLHAAFSDRTSGAVRYVNCQ